MSFVRKFLVKKDERALLFRKGDFVQLLGAGEHVYFDPWRKLSIEVFPLAKARFDHRLASYLAQAESALAGREFHVIELGATEAGGPVRVSARRALRFGG
jgi:hypothetical protein